MGDRYELIKNCAYCKHLNEDIWYAPTCGFFGFLCEKCQKNNFITSDHKVKKIKDVTYGEVYEAISNVSTMMSDEQIKDYAKEVFESLK